MKKLFSKKSIIISAIILVLVITIGVVITLQLKTEKKIEVYALNQIKPLQYSNSSESAELVKKNIVKVVNTIDENRKIVGTGFFDKTGYLVTNSHIVDIKGNITVEYPNGKVENAQLYSNDMTSDIALLAVENQGLKAMFYGETLNLKVTDEVYGIGYAMALEGESSVSKGILSARRSAAGIEFLQSDISLNSGNSGGPLINDKGELLGINTYATENASIGMSISSEALQRIIEKLLNNVEVNYLESERPQNALSVVLVEIGYIVEDVYNEKELITKHDENHDNGNGQKGSQTSKHAGNHDNGKGTQTTKSSLVVKSSDASLSNLLVEGYDIKFNNTVLQYSIILKNNEKSLNITATPTDPKATYVIKNNENFKQGYNTVTITVTAENGTSANYTINAGVPTTHIDGAVSLSCSLNTTRNNGVNSFAIEGCDFIDSDRIRIYPSEPVDVVTSVKIDVYFGWNDSKITGNDCNGRPLRFLKSYTFKPGYVYYIPLNDVRTLLNDDDYEGGSYSGADLTFYVQANTRSNGILTNTLPWGIEK